MKVRGAAGLYVDPPDHAVVISADGKTRSHSLGRTQKPLLMKPGHPGTRTDDDKRSAAAAGKVTGPLAGRCRSQEFLAFLDSVAGGIERGTPVHVLPDNASTHKSTEVSERLRDHGNWSFHFTPARPPGRMPSRGSFPSSRQRLKHAAFNSLDECIAAAEGCTGHHSANGVRPFRWSKQPEDLVEAWKRGHLKLQELASSEIIKPPAVNWNPDSLQHKQTLSGAHHAKMFEREAACNRGTRYKKSHGRGANSSHGRKQE